MPTPPSPIPNITTPVPVSSDPESFDARADLAWTELPVTIDAMNVETQKVYDNAVEAAQKAGDAGDAAELAQKWATQTSGEVEPGQGYGAKKYANDAAASASAAAGSASAANTSAGNAATSATNAASSASAAQSANAGRNGTSTSTVTIGTGAKSFTTQSGKTWALNEFVIIADAAAPTTNWMLGQVTSYSGTTLQVNVTRIQGSGSKSSWTIGLSGPDGAQGVKGDTGDVPGTRTISTAAGSGLTGGGDLTANRSLAVDINGLTQDTNPDYDGDFVMVWDASLGERRKVLISDLNGGEWENYGTPQSVGTGQTFDITGLSALDFKDIRFIISGLSHDGGGTGSSSATIEVGVSNASGTPWLQLPLTPKQAGTSSYSGLVTIENYKDSWVTIFGYLSATTGFAGVSVNVVGGVDKFRVGSTYAVQFDAGTVQVQGRK